MVCDDRLGSINAFTNLPIEHINTRIAESSGRATRKGSPTRVLENRANQLPQFSADELAIHCSPYFTLQAQAKPTIENKRYRSLILPVRGWDGGLSSFSLISLNWKISFYIIDGKEKEPKCCHR